MPNMPPYPIPADEFPHCPACLSTGRFQRLELLKVENTGLRAAPDGSLYQAYPAELWARCPRCFRRFQIDYQESPLLLMP